MSLAKVVLSVCLLALVAATFAAPDSPYGKGEPMPYDFAYSVKDDYSSNDFGHSEQSDGAQVTGEYYVLLPDGRRQVVSYTADHDTGYVANVQYEGEARYDQAPPASPQYS